VAKASSKQRRTPKKPKSSTPGISTEEKILQAAKKLFTQKGFAAVRTRDIAKEAGINLALLNYYYRSKEKLFDIVMMENFRQFIRGISVNLTDESIPLPEKIRKVTTAYIDFLIGNPDLPLFILNELRGNPSELAEKLHQEIGPARQHMINELTAAAKEGKLPPLHPFHFIANLVGLTVFPFVARPLLQKITGVNDEQFIAFMEERKELVPMWINAIMNNKI
jgi:AcrR family transcriptional regulator